MKPDQQSNYWQHDPDEEETPPQEPEMYAPEPLEQPQSEIVVDTPVSEPVDSTTIEPVHWTAHEYIHHERNAGWFFGFAGVVLALIALSIFALGSYTFAILVIVMAIAVVVYTRRPPRDMTYTLSDQGLYIGEKLYHFSEFKSFGIIKDGEHNSIMLIPTKRFSPGVTVYFPDDAGEKIVDVLGTRLPMESLKLDVVDVVIRKLRL